MCTLYRIRSSRDEVARVFAASDAGSAAPDKDYVSAGRDGWVVVADEAGRSLRTMRWGFPPPPSASAPVVNVRNLSSPFWRTALSQPGRRCLVPATSFSEWSTRDPGTGKCTLHWFDVPSRPVFALAGIWRPTAEGAAYAFLTTGPNAIVGAIHPKAMPLVLAEEDHEQWLGGDFNAACALAQPFPSQLMTMTE